MAQQCVLLQMEVSEGQRLDSSRSCGEFSRFSLGGKEIDDGAE